jgi:hypothetical protein
METGKTDATTMQITRTFAEDQDTPQSGNLSLKQGCLQSETVLQALAASVY